jgi:hypothetical protein
MAKRQKALKHKIASLSALGAGALALGTGTAEAGVIYTAVNTTVGFGPGSIPSYASPGLGASPASFSFTARSAFAYGSANLRTIIGYGCGCLKLAGSAGLLRLFNAGAVWDPTIFSTTYAPVGGRVWGSISRYHSGTPGSTYTTYSGAVYYRPGNPGSTTFSTFAQALGLAPFTDMYALFQFHDGPNTLYGWIQLSFSVTGKFGPDAAFGPDLTITAFAYDDAGNQLAAGSIEDVNSPEPATAFSTGLAALALGAAGLRRWRKARQAA